MLSENHKIYTVTGYSVVLDGTIIPIPVNLERKPGISTT
jgi:hypothetical protein